MRRLSYKKKHIHHASPTIVRDANYINPLRGCEDEFDKGRNISFFGWARCGKTDLDSWDTCNAKAGAWAKATADNTKVDLAKGQASGNKLFQLSANNNDTNDDFWNKYR